ncbi:MAG: hypothetical protein WCQ99_13235 [Pseudomonadota bacterium]
MNSFKKKFFMVACMALFLCISMGASCKQKRDSVTYCGEDEKDGPWSNCDPARYNVEGPAERLLNKGVSQIIMVDLTVGGVRFSKTLDVVRMTKRAMADWEKAQSESANPVTAVSNRIGVIYVVHGGFTTYNPLYLWDCSVQMFSYDPNHPVNMLYLFNKSMWKNMLTSEDAAKQLRQYSFEYVRLGGTDPFSEITDKQFQDMKKELDQLGSAQGLEFEADWACWMAGDDVSHYAYPRYLYNPPQETQCATDVPSPATPLVWVNDITNLMERSYPTEPACWTKTLGAPKADEHIPLVGGANSVAADATLALLQAEAVEAGMSENVSDNTTGVILLNHAINDNNEAFDPKINDTLTLNKNIKAKLLERHPSMSPDAIIGAYMGTKEENSENALVERTRPMRGEDLGYAWLYESSKELPADPWGYRYWDALEYLKTRGVKHIVIGFPQIITDSVLNLVEVHNQIAKEIGYKTWLGESTAGLKSLYPGTGNPFADYWGVWVDTECGGEECCFEMGGCSDGRSYPPPRQTALNKKRGAMDPSLAFDVSAYGQLGYKQELGPPAPDGPVQDQYTGTWAMYRPPNDDPRVGQMLAQQVLSAVLDTKK